MATESHSDSFLAAVKSFAKTAGEIFQGFAGAGLFAIIVRALVDFSFRLHWVAGALLSIAVFALAVSLAQLVKRSARFSDLSAGITVLSLSLLTAAAVCASISYAMYLHHSGQYEVPKQYSAGTFMDFYMCTFLDLIPEMKVLETLHWKNPIETRTFYAGLPVLAFKIFVVGILLEALRSWFKRNENSAIAVTK